MEIPIPFAGWVEEDPDELLEFLKTELKGKSETYTFGRKRLQEIVEKIELLKQERDLYKNGFERGTQAAA